MEPFFFGNHYKLFGIYHPPIPRNNRNICIILCYPIGQEHIRSYQVYSNLSHQLSEAGIGVFRFEFYGMGDSEGDLQDADLQLWIENIDLAVNQVSQGIVPNKIFILGCRFSALLVMKYMNEHNKTLDGCILWHPVPSGKAYLNQSKKEHKKWLLGSFAKSKKQDKNEILGFLISEKLRQAVQNIHLNKLLFNFNNLRHVYICAGKNPENFTGNYIYSANEGFWLKNTLSKEETSFIKTDVEIIKRILLAQTDR